MTDILLRTGTYTPEESDDGSEFRTKRFPDGSQIIVNERGIFFIGRRAPYFVSIACGGGQASAGLSQDVGNQPVRSAPILRLVPTSSPKGKPAGTNLPTNLASLTVSASASIQPPSSA
jgi:hypothetical protein